MANQTRQQAPPQADALYAIIGAHQTASADLDRIASEYREALKGVLSKVSELQQVIAEAQTALDDAVADARRLGLSWGQIGEAAGMTGQGAHRRWKHLPDSGS